MLEICGKVLPIPVIGMASGTLNWIAVIIHNNSNSYNNTSRYIIKRRKAAEYGEMEPGGSIQEVCSG